MMQINSADDMGYYYRDQILIEPTNHCNMECIYCTNKNLSYPKGMMSWSLFHKCVDEIAEHPHIKSINLLGMGETFIHPRIFDMIDYIHERGLDCFAGTNGKWQPSEGNLRTLLRLKLLNISIDALTNDTYRLSRQGADVATIWKNVENIIHFKKKMGSVSPYIEVRMNLFNFNRHEIHDLINYCRKIGVDSVILAKGACPPDVSTDLPVADWEKLPHEYVITRGLHPDDAHRSIKIKKDLNNWRLKPEEKGMFDLMDCGGATIHWNGILTLCCFDYNATVTIGDMNTGSLETAWSKANIQRVETDIRNNHMLRVKENKTVACDLCPSFKAYLEQ